MDRTEQRTTRTTHRSSSAAAARAVATNETYPSSSRRSNLTEAGVAGAAGAAVVGHRIDTTSDRMRWEFIINIPFFLLLLHARYWYVPRFCRWDHLGSVLGVGCPPFFIQYVGTVR